MQDYEILTGQFSGEDGVLSAEFIRLRQTLPEEVWMIVIEKLLKQSPDNFERFINSSLFFRNLLASQRTLFFFENVFQIVTSAIWKNKGVYGFPTTEVLKCRQICSKWNSIVDKLVPQKFQHFGEDSYNSSLEIVGDDFKMISKHNRFTNSIYSMNIKTVDRFIQHFDGTHPPASRNPFIWGDLTLKIFTPNDTEEQYESFDSYLEDISSVLSKYGSHLHKISMHIDMYTNFEEASALQEWFVNMPNLRTLKMKSNYWFNCFEDFEDYEPEEYSFPKLDHLETLEIKGLPDIVFYQLIRENSHISTLILNRWHVDYRFYTVPLLNLKKLEFTCNWQEVFEILGSPEVQWPLESLKLTFYRTEKDPSFVEFAKIFQVLENKFGSTLVSLELLLFIDNVEGNEALYQECRKGRLCLPNLKKIKLRVSSVVVCLDFLIPMKENLEEISVKVGYKYPVSPKDMKVASGNTVQFNGFEENILDSNIWTIFEELKTVEVTVPRPGFAYDNQKLCFNRNDRLRQNSIKLD